MARHLLRLTLAATFAFGIPLVHGEDEGARDAHMKSGPEHPYTSPRSQTDAPGGERSRREKNMDRWKDLPPERREAMRDAARERVKRMKEELNILLQQAGGDNLTPEKREQIEARYFEARRELEGRLRREMDAARDRELPKIIQAIKVEFSIE